MSKWITHVLGVQRLHRRRTFKYSGHHGSAGKGLGLVWFSFGPPCRCGEECRGCRRGRKNCTHLRLYLLFSGLERLPPKLLPSLRKFADPKPAFRGIVVSRHVRCFAPSLPTPLRGLVIHRVAGAGSGARTCAARGGACLNAAARRRLVSRRCIWLR